jgi:hypothetical protein
MDLRLAASKRPGVVLSSAQSSVILPPAETEVTPKEGGQSAMAPTAAHPGELAELDLFEVWTGAEPLGKHFDAFRWPRMAAC